MRWLHPYLPYLGHRNTVIGRFESHAGIQIHDNAREGDEPHIYQRLYEFILELERAFGKREPSFQYIVTTKTS